MKGSTIMLIILGALSILSSILQLIVFVLIVLGVIPSPGIVGDWIWILTVFLIVVIFVLILTVIIEKS